MFSCFVGKAIKGHNINPNNEKEEQKEDPMIIFLCLYGLRI